MNTSKTTAGHPSIGTMHLDKGLESGLWHDELRRRNYALQERIETVGDDADLQEVYDTERHLLYVAGTLDLLVTGVEPVSVSEFLDDFTSQNPARRRFKQSARETPVPKAVTLSARATFTGR